MERKEFNYINVIPFVDIMLVLLTIVLLTSTFITTGMLPVELPKAANTEHEKKLVKTQVIEIDRKGTIYLNSKLISLKGLEEELILVNKNTPIVIKADKYIALQVFVDIIDIINKFEFGKITLLTEEKSG